MAENLLTRLFARKGIKSVDELSKEERATFDNYEKVLSKTELSVGDIKDFLKSQISLIEGKWRDLGLNSMAKAELIPLHTVYRALLTAIDAPMLEREQLETYLRGLIKD
jgi:hypothetical protein